MHALQIRLALGEEARPCVAHFDGRADRVTCVDEEMQRLLGAEVPCDLEERRVAGLLFVGSRGAEV